MFATLLQQQLINAINHPQVRDNLTVLVIDVLSRPDVLSQVNALTANVVQSDEVSLKVSKVLADSVTSDIVKKASLSLSTATVNSILADPQIRQNLSETLYSAVTPQLFKRRTKIAAKEHNDSNEPKF